MTVGVSSYHPSFLPLKDKIQERGPFSPYAQVEFWTKEGHGHHTWSDSIGEGVSVEDVAEVLVDAMQACGPERAPDQNGRFHGKTHDPAQLQDAYHSAVQQLLTRDYDTEWIYYKWLQYMYKKWGGHIPAAVIMPIDDQLKMLIPDELGDPHLYDVSDKSGLQDVIEPPTDENSVEAPIGRYRKPKWSAERRLRHLRKKGL